MKDIKNAEKFATLLAKARLNAGFSQKQMAKLLGRSVSTIQNWESGYVCPSFFDTMDWFEVLGINPMRYLLNYLYPLKYENLNTLSNDIAEIEKTKSALNYYIDNIASDSEILKIAFNVLGETGSSWNSQLDMLTAHNHLPLTHRIFVAQQVLDAFLLAKARNVLNCADQIMPDIEELERAVISAKQSIIEGAKY